MNQELAAKLRAMGDMDLLAYSIVAETYAKGCQRIAARTQREADAARKEMKRRKREGKAA